jgi:putative membrane protein
MKTTIIVAAVVAGAALLGSMGAAQAQTAMPDATFVGHVGAANAAEVELARAAETRASDQAVRQYADRLEVDHRATGAELQALGARKGWQVPTQPDGQHLAVRDRLMTLSGPEFDRQFVDEMVKDHNHAIAEFETAATTANDTELRDWAQKMLPVLREHRYMAQELSQRLIAAPAALPRSAVIVVTPWCDGSYDPSRGSNFAACPR